VPVQLVIRLVENLHGSISPIQAFPHRLFGFLMAATHVCSQQMCSQAQDLLRETRDSNSPAVGVEWTALKLANELMASPFGHIFGACTPQGQASSHLWR